MPELKPAQLDALEDALEDLLGRDDAPGAWSDDPAVRERLRAYRAILELARDAMPLEEVPAGLMDGALAEARAAANAPTLAPSVDAREPSRSARWIRDLLWPTLALATAALIVFAVVPFGEGGGVGQLARREASKVAAEAPAEPQPAAVPPERVAEPAAEPAAGEAAPEAELEPSPDEVDEAEERDAAAESMGFPSDGRLADAATLRADASGEANTASRRGSGLADLASPERKSRAKRSRRAPSKSAPPDAFGKGGPSEPSSKPKPAPEPPPPQVRQERFAPPPPAAPRPIQGGSAPGGGAGPDAEAGAYDQADEDDAVAPSAPAERSRDRKSKTVDDKKESKVESSPDWKSVERGDGLRRSGRCSAAERHYRRAIKNEDRRVAARGWAGLGLCKRDAGDASGANAAFARARSLDPNVSGFITSQPPPPQPPPPGSNASAEPME